MGKLIKLIKLIYFLMGEDMPLFLEMFVFALAVFEYFFEFGAHMREIQEGIEDQGERNNCVDCEYLLFCEDFLILIQVQIEQEVTKQLEFLLGLHNQKKL